MEAERFLGGKVLKRSLPIIQPNPGSPGPSLKRLLLPQGELAQFYDGDEGIRFIAFIELREGSTRGNHYHKIKVEWVYVIQGEVMLLLKDIESNQQDSLSLKAGDLAQIPVKIAHALKTVASGQAIEFSGARFDSTDTYRFAVE